MEVICELGYSKNNGPLDCSNSGNTGIFLWPGSLRYECPGVAAELEYDTGELVSCPGYSMQVLSNRWPSFASPQLPFDITLGMAKPCFGMRDFMHVVHIRQRTSRTTYEPGKVSLNNARGVESGIDAVKPNMRFNTGTESSFLTMP